MFAFANSESEVFKAPNGLVFQIYSREFTQNLLFATDLEHDIEIGGDEIENSLPDQEAMVPWRPGGSNTRTTAYDCSQESLGELIWSSHEVSQQATKLQKWTERCHRQSTRFWQRHGFWSIFRFASVYYPLKYHPKVRYVRIKLPDKRVLAGFLALKDDGVARPLVIGKCGMFCGADNGVLHRNFIMHLFDESPFNVLTLANISGADFQIDNKAMSVGGFDEGRQIYQIAEFLKSSHSPIVNYISSLHVIGGSLGAHGALYASLYASLNKSQNPELVERYKDKPLLDSVIAMCPVVVLENSAKRLFSKGAVSTAASQITINHLKHLIPYIPIVGQFIEVTRKVNKDRLFKGLTQAMVEYYKDYTSNQDWELAPFRHVKIDAIDQFWALNDFTQFQGLVNIPTIVISSEDDRLVWANENALLLKESPYFKADGQVQVLHLKDGGHCAFSVANGWANYSEILRSFILSHSPEVRGPTSNKRIEISQYMNFRDSKIDDFVFEPSKRKHFLKLRLKYSKKKFRSYGCEQSPDANPNDQARCSTETESLIPINALLFNNDKILNEEFYLNQIVRFANTRFLLLDSELKTVRKTGKNPKYLQWTDYRL